MKAQPSREEKPKSRLEALADGTFAIVFTILVLELFIRNREFPSADAFTHYLLGLAPKFWSYLLSFTILATYWLGHVEQLYYVARINRPFVLANLLFLFFISLIPFSTTLISEYGGFSLSTRLYGINLVGCQLAFYLNWYMAASANLRGPSLTPRIKRGHSKYIFVGLLCQLAGIGLSFVDARAGLVILALVPISYLLLFVIDKRSFSELYQ